MNALQLNVLKLHGTQFLKNPCLKSWISKELFLLTHEWEIKDWKELRTISFWEEYNAAKTAIHRQVITYQFVAVSLGFSYKEIQANIDKWDTNEYYKKYED